MAVSWGAGPEGACLRAEAAWGNSPPPAEEGSQPAQKRQGVVRTK